jgi:sulfoxide reductase heme-binding subunit YedZ
MLGLFAFSYASMHFLTYAGIDQVLDVKAIFTDITKRPFIAVGFSALVLLVPLAVTSTDAMVRRLGFVRWKRLHRLVYLAAALGVVHFIWRVKKDISQPLTYAVVLGILLAARVVDYGFTARRRVKRGPSRIQVAPRETKTAART